MREFKIDNINISYIRKSPENKERKGYLVDVFTGIRPTGDLTVANYLGAIKPIVKLQNSGKDLMVFVADLHALTDHEPSQARKFTNAVVADYIALGLKPDRTTIFAQSKLNPEISTLITWLSRHISAAELLRVPTLKEKLKKGSRPETANTLLLLYPLMMAADILLQRAREVPVGEDQLAHMEVTRKLVRRFNKQYGDVLPMPKVLQVESLRIKSLRGDGKMSKTNPDGAIFLTDTAEVVEKKIKSAKTAFAGEMTDMLRSHTLLAKELAYKKRDRDDVDQIIRDHMSGKKVMGDFKKILTTITQDFLEKFQEERKAVVRNPNYIPEILESGSRTAKKNARETLGLIEKAMWSPDK